MALSLSFWRMPRMSSTPSCGADTGLTEFSPTLADGISAIPLLENNGIVSNQAGVLTTVTTEGVTGASVSTININGAGNYTNSGTPSADSVFSYFPLSDSTQVALRNNNATVTPPTINIAETHQFLTPAARTAITTASTNLRSYGLSRSSDNVDICRTEVDTSYSPADTNGCFFSSDCQEVSLGGDPPGSGFCAEKVWDATGSLFIEGSGTLYKTTPDTGNFALNNEVLDASSPWLTPLTNHSLALMDKATLDANQKLALALQHDTDAALSRICLVDPLASSPTLSSNDCAIVGNLLTSDNEVRPIARIGTYFLGPDQASPAIAVGFDDKVMVATESLIEQGLDLTDPLITTALDSSSFREVATTAPVTDLFVNQANLLVATGGPLQQLAATPLAFSQSAAQTLTVDPAVQTSQAITGLLLDAPPTWDLHLTAAASQGSVSVPGGALSGTATTIQTALDQGQVQWTSESGVDLNQPVDLDFTVTVTSGAPSNLQACLPTIAITLQAQDSTPAATVEPPSPAAPNNAASDPWYAFLETNQVYFYAAGAALVVAIVMLTAYRRHKNATDVAAASAVAEEMGAAQPPMEEGGALGMTTVGSTMADMENVATDRTTFYGDADDDLEGGSAVATVTMPAMPDGSAETMATMAMPADGSSIFQSPAAVGSEQRVGTYLYTELSTSTASGMLTLDFNSMPPEVAALIGGIVHKHNGNTSFASMGVDVAAPTTDVAQRQRAYTELTAGEYHQARAALEATQTAEAQSALGVLVEAAGQLGWGDVPNLDNDAGMVYLDDISDLQVEGSPQTSPNLRA